VNAFKTEAPFYVLDSTVVVRQLLAYNNCIMFDVARSDMCITSATAAGTVTNATRLHVPALSVELATDAERQN